MTLGQYLLITLGIIIVIALVALLIRRAWGGDGSWLGDLADLDFGGEGDGGDSGGGDGGGGGD